MQLRSLAALAGLALLTGSLVPAHAADLAAAHRAAKGAFPAIVLVRYVLARESRGFSATGQRSDAAAVGTIVTPDGLVLVPGAIFPEDPEEQRDPSSPQDFLVRLGDGRVVKASLVGRDRVASLAFLQLERAGSETFPFVKLEPASLDAGDELLLTELLPERYGFAPTSRRASVAAVLSEPRALVDVDARLDESAIGAPAFDSRGRAVGLVVTDPIGETPGALPATQRVIGIYSRQKDPGYPMLMPASSILPLIASPPRNAASAAAERAWLGVTLQPVPRALAERLGLASPTGVMVTSVWPGSPADKAGLAVEDVITRFDGRPIEVQAEDSLPDFIEGVQRTGAGRPVKLDVFRGGAARSIDITLGVAPTPAVRATEYRSRDFGLAAQDLTLDVRLARAWPETLTGAFVTEVEQAGWASVGGLRRADLIQAVDGEAVTNVADLEARLEAVAQSKAKEAVFFVLRDPDTLFIRVETSW